MGLLAATLLKLCRASFNFLCSNKAEPKLEDFYQKGTEQKAAGFVVYGPATVFVLTTGRGVNMFTLDNSIGEFVLTTEGCRIPEETTEYAINMANKRFWEAPMLLLIALKAIGSLKIVRACFVCGSTTSGEQGQ